MREARWEKKLVESNRRAKVSQYMGLRSLLPNTAPTRPLVFARNGKRKPTSGGGATAPPPNAACVGPKWPGARPGPRVFPPRRSMVRPEQGSGHVLLHSLESPGRFSELSAIFQSTYVLPALPAIHQSNHSSASWRPLLPPPPRRITWTS